MKRFDHQKIKELLTEGLKPIEVANAVGCTRELVRQLDLVYFGTTGRERAFAKRLQESSIPPDSPFVVVARSKGMAVESTLTRSLKPSTRTVIVNGHRCSMFKTIKRVIGRNTYWQIRRSSTIADFYVWNSPAGFLILPHSEQPRDTTIITLTQKLKPGAYSKRHDYQQYLNAWGQLERKKHENLKAS